jgi:hypothetical protein
MVVGGSSPASDVVITVEPARTQSRSWSGEARAAVRNNGSGLRGWIAEEAVWMLAQFAKVALSVFVVRAVTKLFQTGAASRRPTSGPRPSGRTATTSESTRRVTERLGGRRPVALPVRGAVATQPERTVGAARVTAHAVQFPRTPAT